MNLLDIGIFLKPSSIMAQIPFVEPTSACLSILLKDGFWALIPFVEPTTLVHSLFMFL